MHRNYDELLDNLQKEIEGKGMSVFFSEAALRTVVAVIVHPKGDDAYYESVGTSLMKKEHKVRGAQEYYVALSRAYAQVKTLDQRALVLELSGNDQTFLSEWINGEGGDYSQHIVYLLQNRIYP